MISPPINLGQAGLSLGMRLYFQAPGGVPVAQATGTVTVNSLGGVDYYFGGLPEPPSGSAGVLVIFEAAAPALALYRYVYGTASSATVLVLGEAGLVLTLRLYFHEPGLAPVAQALEDAVLVEIGLGDYYLSALPEPPAGSLAFVVLYAASAPALAWYTHGYAPLVPDAAVVWRGAFRPAEPVQRVVAGDTWGAVAGTVLDGLPAEIGAAGTSVTMTLYDVKAGAALFEARPAVISGVAEDPNGNGWGCTLSCARQPGDTAAPSSFRARFTITFNSGSTLTVPPDDSLRVEVVPDYDAP